MANLFSSLWAKTLAILTATTLLLGIYIEVGTARRVNSENERSKAEACLARQKLLVSTMPAKPGSGGASESWKEYERRRAEFDRDCTGTTSRGLDQLEAEAQSKVGTLRVEAFGSSLQGSSVSRPPDALAAKPAINDQEHMDLFKDRPAPTGIDAFDLYIPKRLSREACIELVQKRMARGYGTTDESRSLQECTKRPSEVNAKP